jgi:hypothetical protein
MTTHSIVGVYDDAQRTTWHAVPVGADGYPSGVGRSLYLNYRHVFKGDLAALVRRVVEDRPAGWYSVAGKNLFLPAIVQQSDYIAVTEAKHQLVDEARYFQTSSPRLSRWAYRASLQLDAIPVAYPKRWVAFIDQDRLDEDWAEWSYLFDVPQRQLYVFWGCPNSPFSEAVSLDTDRPEAFWNHLWSSLPERETR